MSLINDALKRAKQAQQQASPSGASGPQLRPAEASLQKGRTLGLALPIFIVALIALGLFFAWGRFHETSKKKGPAPQPAPVTKTIPSPAREPDATPQPASAVSHKPAVAALSTPEAAPVPAADSTSSLPTHPLASSSVTSEKTTAPPQAPLKLQGILFDPAHPAAMIGGKMLFINDKLGDWKVVAINRESATLVNAGQTNILSLPQ